MHLVTLSVQGRANPGVAVGDELLDLAAAAQVISEARGLPATMRAILGAGDPVLKIVRTIHDRVLHGPDALREQLRQSNALIARPGATLLAPIPDPGLILGAGLNYHAHLKEMKNTPVPAKPASLYKSPAAV